MTPKPSDIAPEVPDLQDDKRERFPPPDDPTEADDREDAIDEPDKPGDEAAIREPDVKHEAADGD